MEKTKEDILKNRFATAYFLTESKTIICEAQNNYIPEKEFKEIFISIGEYVKIHKVEKLIFDKTKLSVFHQPSMVWYHVVWKNDMLRYGLRKYCKILPKDEFFRKSVQIGREKIQKDHPEFHLEKFNIQYCESLEEALAL